MDCKLLNGVATVEQLPGVAVDVGDGGVTRGRREKARVVGELARAGVELANVDDVWANASLHHREVDGGRSVAK